MVQFQEIDPNLAGYQLNLTIILKSKCWGKYKHMHESKAKEAYAQQQAQVHLMIVNKKRIN